jgi:osmoprotectant transport system permease protein
VWTGVVVVVLLALIVDLLLVQVGRLVLPWTRKTVTFRPRLLRVAR